MALPATNPFSIFWKKLPKPLRNKYFLSLTVFFAMLVFLDKHDLLTQWKLRGSVKRLENDKAFYEQKIRESRQDMQNLQNNREQFAREKYHMHKSNEEVFIIQE